MCLLIYDCRHVGRTEMIKEEEVAPRAVKWPGLLRSVNQI